MLDEEFYKDKLLKIEQKRQQILQKYINSGFEMVSEIQDIKERQQEIETLIKVNQLKEDMLSKKEFVKFAENWK